MKIFGISMVRDEADIVGLSVLHNLSLGLDRVIVLDNGSTDGTDEILRRLANADRRVRWIRDDSPFDQSAVTTDLAREAHRQGADWIVPFDADEFWWGERGSFREVLTESGFGSLGARVVTFVQARGQHRSTPEALMTMTRRPAELAPRPGQGGLELVESNRAAFVQMQYPPKLVSRPRADTAIYRGNHKVTGVAGPHGKDARLVCFHAPLRSRAHLASKMERSRRLTEAGISRNSGARHVWRWARLIEEGGLEREWAANSYEGDSLDVYGKRRQVVFDPRLRDLVGPHLSHLLRGPLPADVL